MELERQFYTNPAHDCHDGCNFDNDRCKPGSGGYHGIGSVNATMAVIGPLGAISFYWLTGWYWNETRERLESESSYLQSLLLKPMAGGLDFHSPVEVEYAYRRDECRWFGDQPCWSDGSVLRADEPLQLLLHEGSDAVWTFLEAEYASRFESGDDDA